MDALELRRLRWRCRRGLLENDIVLTRFLERHAGTLSGERLSAFERLIEREDNDLWDVLSGRVDPGPVDEATREVVQMLRNC